MQMTSTYVYVWVPECVHVCSACIPVFTCMCRCDYMCVYTYYISWSILLVCVAICIWYNIMNSGITLLWNQWLINKSLVTCTCLPHDFIKHEVYIVSTYVVWTRVSMFLRMRVKWLCVYAMLSCFVDLILLHMLKKFYT